MNKPHNRNEYAQYRSARKAAQKATNAREHGNAHQSAKAARVFRLAMKERVEA